MRTKEQFKAYVYEKANEKRLIQKHNRTVFVRGFAAFSLLFIISGVLVFGNFINKNSRTAEDASGVYSNENGKAFVYFSNSVLSDSVDDGLVEEQAPAVISVELCNAEIETVYSQSTEKDASSFSFKNDIADYKRETKGADCKSTPITKEAAIEIAKEKCTIDHNAIDVFFDSQEAIWKVVFYTKNTAGGCQTVYLNCDGTLRLIVYGE